MPSRTTWSADCTVAITGTEPPQSSEGNALIDHIVVDGRLQVKIDRIIPRRNEAGARLTDHAGIVASIQTQGER
jgi:endonuclease/exonuclease/phosphatase family metal-dependent hydrolase